MNVAESKKGTVLLDGFQQIIHQHNQSNHGHETDGENSLIWKFWTRLSQELQPEILKLPLVEINFKGKKNNPAQSLLTIINGSSFGILFLTLLFRSFLKRSKFHDGGIFETCFIRTNTFFFKKRTALGKGNSGC